MAFFIPQKLRYRLLLVAVGLLLVGAGVDWLLVSEWRHIRTGYDTTRLTSPLRADGSVDYVQAIEDRMSAGVTAENNAAPLFLKAVGPKLINAAGNAENVYQYLGMAPLPEKGDYYQEYFTFVREQYHTPDTENEKTYDEQELTETHLWTAEEHGQVAEWLKANAGPLELYRQASLRERFYIPYRGQRTETVVGIMLPSLGAMRMLANTTASRALLRGGAGDFAGAMADLMTIHRSARLVGHGWTIIERLVAVAMDNLAGRAERALATSGRLTAGQAKELLAELEGLPPLPPMAEALDFERYGVLDLLVFASRRGWQAAFQQAGGREEEGFSAAGLQALDMVPANFGAAMYKANGFYDEYVAAAKAPTYAQRQALNSAVEKKVEAMASSLPLGGVLQPADRLLAMMMPSLGRADALYDANVMEDGLTRLALALAAYHAEHAGYPERLAELAPEYLRAIPTDLFIDAPLRYRRTATGYLLYSVGMNMSDDGGHGRENRDPKFPSADDLGVWVGTESSTTASAPAP